MESDKFKIVEKEDRQEYEVLSQSGVLMAIIYEQRGKYRIRFGQAPGWVENGKPVEWGEYETPEKALNAIEWWDGRSDVEDQ